jgi:hypothetical protein
LLLRGELAYEIESSLEYLRCMEERVEHLVQKDGTQSELFQIDIESCGKSRVPLDGLVQYLHRENLYALYARLKSPGKRKTASKPAI